MKLRPGQQVVSTIDDTKMIVVRAPEQDVVLTCGGVEMVDAKSAKPGVAGTADPQQMGGTVLGKRYTDEELGLELLCTKPGSGTVAVNGVPLTFKEAKPLPASD